jgi:hypothetical protein
MARLKIYYPENQIQRNLYTSGKVWMLEDGTEFIGYYHTYTSGEVYTERSWNPARSQKLIPYKTITNASMDTVYQSITSERVETFISPRSYFPIPKDSDYKAGFISRYFVQKNNDVNSIIEINKGQFDSITTSGVGINGNLYKGIKIDWKLTGPRFDITTGMNTVYGVSSTNRRLVVLATIDMPGIDNVLTDYAELSIYWPPTPVNIKLKFGSLN